METKENSISWLTRVCRQVGELLGAFGTLFEGTNKFIVAGVAVFGTITTIIIINPDQPEPYIPDKDGHVDPIKPDPIPPVFNEFDVGGTWYDDEGNKINIEQNGTTIRLVMTSTTEFGIPIEMNGSGVMNDQTVHMELGAQAFGQATDDKLPVDITFATPRKAIMAMNMGGVSISGNLHR